MTDHQYASLDAPLTGRRQTPGRPGLARPTGTHETPAPLMRPYTWTGARARPRYQLAIEALVSTTTDPERLRGLLPEHQRIVLLCRETTSVAEISALLAIPLGIARVLVADLVEAGLVTLHQPVGDAANGGRPDATFLERVLSGLRGLPDTINPGQDDDGPPTDSTADPRQRLTEAHKTLTDDLGDILDVEAGLREALLQSHHDATVNDLGDVLDVEAGLRDALEGPSGPEG